jgi:hypothetical protein
MSVQVGFLIEDDTLLKQKTQGADFTLLYVRGEIMKWDFELDIFALQMYWSDVFERVRDKLTASSQASLSEFLNTVFWSWRGDEAVNIIETDIEDEILNAAWSPSTCCRLLKLATSINLDEIAQYTDDFGKFADFKDYKSYFLEYINLLKLAVSENKTLYMLVY